MQLVLDTVALSTFPALIILIAVFAGACGSPSYSSATVSVVDLGDSGAIPLGNAWTIQVDILLPMTPTPGDWATLFRGGDYTALAGGAGSHHVIVSSWDGGTIGMFDNENSNTGFQSTGVQTTSFSAGWHTLVVRGFAGVQQFAMDGTLFGTVGKQATSSIRWIKNLGSQLWNNEVKNLIVYQSACDGERHSAGMRSP